MTSVGVFPYGTTAASGLTGACSETGTLSGTSGSPNTSSDFETSPVDALAGWRLMTDGTIDRVVNDVWSQFQDGTEYTDGQDSPACDWYVKATVDSGDAPSTGTLNTWLKVAGGSSFNRTWTWIEDSDPGTQASTSGTLKIEISNDASGSPVEATGYYKGTATQFGTL